MCTSHYLSFYFTFETENQNMKYVVQGRKHQKHRQYIYLVTSNEVHNE